MGTTGPAGAGARAGNPGTGAGTAGSDRAGARAGTAGPGAGPPGSDRAGPGAAPAGPQAAPGQLSGVEPLELVGESPERLTAEAQAALETAPADLAPGETAPEPSAPWSMLTPALTDITCAVVFPAWEITPDERGEISPALAECMEQLFPGGIEGRYACWVRLIAACGAITVSRVYKHGRIPPLFAARVGPSRGHQADAMPGAAPPMRDGAPLQPVAA